MSLPLTTASGKTIQKLIYGTAYKQWRTRRLLGQALRIGYRSIDTGNWRMFSLPFPTQNITNSRHLVKNFLENYTGLALTQTEIPRGDLFLQSKFVSLPHHKPYLPPYPAYEGPNADEACELSFYLSLQNLQTNYLDAFLINAPDLTPESLLSLLEVLQKLKSKGFVRYTGICNIATVEVLQTLHTANPDALQIVQNPLHSPWDPDYKIPQYCRKHGIQYNTFYTLTMSDRLVKHKVVREIASQRNLTPQQIFLQYCVQSDMTPLVGARSESNLNADVTIANGDIEPLSKDDLRSVGRLFAEQAIINHHRRVLLLDRQEREAKRKRGERAVEVAVDYAVPDAAKYVTRVVRMKASVELAVL